MLNEDKEKLKRIPLFVKIISVLFILLSVFTFLFWIGSLSRSFSYTSVIINSIVILLTSALYLISGIKMWKGKKSGRVIAIVISSIAIVALIALEIFSISLNKSFGITAIQSLKQGIFTLIGIVVYCGLLYYLIFNSRVKEAFK